MEVAPRDFEDPAVIFDQILPIPRNGRFKEEQTIRAIWEGGAGSRTSRGWRIRPTLNPGNDSTEPHAQEP